MSVFNKLRAKIISNPQPLTPDIQSEEEYVVTQLVPLKLPLTLELSQRKREEELKKKYCHSTVYPGRIE
ncbi:hypothetical protein OBV_p-00480 (plasmid) [Oscillibacter valericigenes Sjm18-20]|nr:hypothetical protein OBV_p-00480 [Oscillibacter valericigenes Sjm18-20]